METMQEVTLPAPVEEFLHRLATGDWRGMEEHLADDVFYDATVPDWHYQYAGRDRVLQEYREEWSGRYRWTVAEVDPVVTGDAAFVLLEIHGEPTSADTGPVVCRLSNLFRLDGGRIVSHRFTCCGEWDGHTVRNIDEHAPMVERRAR